MLQQTRVNAVLDHYRRFLERFPDVRHLARAREQSVLAAWSGLGYYRRARHMHAAAKVVAFERAGKFPETVEELRELPGIGRYTAAAIASIAFGGRAAVVDGNVERVLQRMTGNSELEGREVWHLADGLLSPNRPGDFNQAMMELGATVCSPRDPRCLECPVMTLCKTRGAHPRRQKEVRKIVPVGYALVRANGSVWMVQRSRDASLMAGMWELPQAGGTCAKEPLARMKHSILDTDFQVAVHAGVETGENGRWVRNSALKKMALTGLARKILRHFELL